MHFAAFHKFAESMFSIRGTSGMIVVAVDVDGMIVVVYQGVQIMDCFVK